MPKMMMVLLTAVLACALFGGRDALSMDLNQFQWKNRLLFIFAPQEGDEVFQALQSEMQEGDEVFQALQSEMLTLPDEISERDLVVFKIFETGPSFMETSRIDPQTAAAIRTKFAAPLGQFTCILVGKDGGVKLKRHAPVKLEEIFGLIDAMPMRREEMRKKSQSDKSNTTS
jgi:hypothetical protein